MSTVPYIFANNTGNIPLSELDANFANVKSSVDYASTAGQAVVATTAVNVTYPIQGNITSVGTLTTLSVTGTITSGANVVGNYFLGNGRQLTGIISSYSNSNVASYLPTYTGDITGLIINASANLIGGNVLTAGFVSATGNATAGNINTGGVISATGNVRGSNINTAGVVTATGNVTGGNVLTAGFVSATGNVTGGNVLTAGFVSATGNVTGGNITALGISSSYQIESTNITATNIQGDQINGPAFLSYTDTTYPETPVDTVSLSGSIEVNGLENYSINYIRVTANATSANLSSTLSTNIIQANNTGYTATIVFPSDYPVNQGTVVRFTVAGGNAVTLIGDGGNLAIVPSFDGLTAVGTGYTYMLVLEPFTSGYWARVV